VLFEGIDRARYEPLLICPEPGPFVGTMRDRGITTAVVRLAPLINPMALVRLASLLARHKVGVLQTHGARSNFYGAVAGRLAGVPVIIATVHNALGDYEISPLRRGIYAAALRRALRLVDRVVCVSEALRQDTQRSLGVPSERVATIYNGLDPTRFRRARDSRAIRAELRIGDGPMLLAVGRLTEQKGHRYLLEALPALLGEWPGLRCVIVGDGELRVELPEVAARLGVAHACSFTGARPDIPDLLAAADLAVLPSVSEGFPFILLEALAASKPVVASRIEGVTELIRDGQTGSLVPPRDPAALAEAARALLRNPDRARALAAAGERLVRERFTADAMVSQTVAVFESSWQGKAPTVERRVYGPA
jgi:glycosyltransferase involved in cell wall biosynthesis